MITCKDFFSHGHTAPALVNYQKEKWNFSDDRHLQCLHQQCLISAQSLSDIYDAYAHTGNCLAEIMFT